MTKKDYSKYEAKEELGTLSFNHVLLHKRTQNVPSYLLIITKDPLRENKQKLDTVETFSFRKLVNM